MSTSNRPVSRRHQMRLVLGGAAILTVAQASELMPMADSRATEWLERERLVRLLDGRRVVIWGDVLDKLRGPPPAPTQQSSTNSRRSKGSLRRTRLD